MKARIIPLLIFVAITIVACDQPTDPSQPDMVRQAVDLVIRNVTVITMVDSERISGANVAVDKGKIIAIGSAASEFSYAGAEEFDGTGKFLMPGLIDNHVHILTPFDAPLYPAAGVTTVRNMWGFASHLELRKMIDKGDFFGPRIITAGRLMDGNPKLWPQSLAPETPNDALKIIEEDVAAGYNFVKVYSRMKPEMLTAIATIAISKGLDFVGHVPEQVDIRDAARLGMKSMEHLWGMPGALHPTEDFVAYDALDRSQWNSVDLSKLDALSKVLVDNDVWIAPTLLVLEHIYLAGSPELLRDKVDGVEYVSPGTIDSWEAGAKSKDPVSAESREKVEDILATRARIMKRLYDNGVRLLLGTDTNNVYIVHGYAIYDEIQMYVDAGIPLADVLRISTRDAAEFLGLLEELGTIAVGKYADMIVLNRDPFLSVANLKDRAGVVVRGKYHPDSELREALLQNREYAEAYIKRAVQNTTPSGKD